MENLTQLWVRRGFSESAANSILASWATNTRKQYNSALSRWGSFCAASGANSSFPKVSEVCNFLSALAEDGRSYASVASHKAAIIAFCQSVNDHTLLADSVILSRCMKGIFSLKAPIPRSNKIWDPSVVLNFLRSLGNNDKLTLEVLLQKCATLLALCSSKRVSELAALNLDECSTDGEVLVFILRRTKNRRMGPAHEARVQAFNEDPTLCPVKCINELMTRTKDIRSSPNLLISWRKPYGAVSPDTVSRWIKVILEKAGIQGFSAHSTRSASTSKAAVAGVRVEEILKAANWSRGGSTFARFYQKAVATNEVQNAVLRYLAPL